MLNERVGRLTREGSDEEEDQSISEELDELENWSNRGEIKFNLAKCKTVHSAVNK